MNGILQVNGCGKTENIIMDYQYSHFQIGYCDIWASLFMERFGGDHQWSFDFPNDPNGHSWVKLGNKFYDAEMLNGTTELTNLPFFQRFIKKYGTAWLDAEFYTNIQKTKYDASGIDTPCNPNM
jgi:hypothetical protein